MTKDIQHRRKGLRQKIADYSNNPEKVMELFEQQDAQIQKGFLKAEETHAAAKHAFFTGMVGILERTIREGRSGLWAGKYFTAKASAELYSRAPYLFDQFSKKAFDGATSLAECRQWLEDEELDEGIVSVYQMYSASFRNIVNKEWGGAEADLTALLSEIKSEMTEE